jgi:hypothetical protein
MFGGVDKILLEKDKLSNTFKYYVTNGLWVRRFKVKRETAQSIS